MKSDMNVTISEIQTFCDCRLKWYYSYIKLLKQKDRSIKSMRGTVVHDGISLINSNKEPDLDNFSDESKGYIKRLEEANELSPVTNTIAKYKEWHTIKKEEGWSVIESEKQFKVKLPGLFRTTLSGKVDSLFLNKQHELWVVEYKTKASMSGADAFKLSVDKQTAGYIWAVSEVMNKMPVGCVYVTLLMPDVTIKDKQGWYDKRLLTDCIFSIEVIYPWSDIREFVNETKVIVREMRQGNLYRRPSRDCSWGCGFTGLCIEPSEDTMNINYAKKISKHEELD